MLPTEQYEGYVEEAGIVMFLTVVTLVKVLVAINCHWTVLCSEGLIIVFEGSGADAVTDPFVMTSSQLIDVSFCTSCEDNT